MSINDEVSTGTWGNPDPVVTQRPSPADAREITVHPTAYQLLYPSQWDGNEYGLRVLAVGRATTKAGQPHRSARSEAVLDLDQVPEKRRAFLLEELEDKIRSNAEAFELLQAKLAEAAETLRASLTKCSCPPDRPGAVSFGCRCDATPEQRAEFAAEWSRWVD